MKFNTTYDYTQFYQLAVTLIARGYTVEIANIWDGKQINVYSQNEIDDTQKEFLWDAVIHYFSYGHEDGLLEVYGTIVSEFTSDDTVCGWLKADKILSKCPQLDSSLF